MGSGNRRVIFNTRERDVSTDHNRLQDMSAAATHELGRGLVNRDQRGSTGTCPGVNSPLESLPPSSDFLVPHDCWSGYMVVPDNDQSLLITPGEAGFYVPAFPNASADDSKYVMISTTGVKTLGVLTFLANGGAGVRWDIVECQPTEVLEESSSRDIYNTTTGLFTPATVEKVRAGSMTFRIRRGTAGAGIPDIDSAWMPLAACHIRTDATGFSNSDLYDIRPLVEERVPLGVRPPLAPPVSVFGYRSVLSEATISTVGSLAGINGLAMGGYALGAFGGYYSGGYLANNLPAVNLANFGDVAATGAAFPFLNFEDATKRSAAFALVSNAVFTIGAFFPRGYSRWVRYSEVALAASVSTRLKTAGRVPNGPRGLIMAIAGADAAGTISRNGMIGPVPLPTHVGETQNCFGHVIGYAVSGTAGNDVYPPRGGNKAQKFSWQMNTVSATPPSLLVLIQLADPPGPVFTVDTGSVPTGAKSATALFHPGSDNVPATAEAVLLDINLQIQVADGKQLRGTRVTAYTSNNAQDLDVSSLGEFANNSGGTLTMTQDIRVWLPLRPGAVWDSSSIQDTVLAIEWFGGSAAFPADPVVSCSIKGYSF